MLQQERGSNRGVWSESHFTTVPDVTSCNLFDGVLAAMQSLYLLRSLRDVNPRRIGGSLETRGEDT